ncbi:hypothetical protein BREVUG8_110307 [Brevundimonas sp. G8]|nr:hypothetical protein BREVUG8_110307 [Brevundimonas sp. G8]
MTWAMGRAPEVDDRTLDRTGGGWNGDLTKISRNKAHPWTHPAASCDQKAAASGCCRITEEITP